MPTSILGSFSRSGCLELTFHPPKIKLECYCWSQDDVTCIQLCLICCREVGNIAPFPWAKITLHNKTGGGFVFFSLLLQK